MDRVTIPCAFSAFPLSSFKNSAIAFFIGKIVICRLLRTFFFFFFTKTCFVDLTILLNTQLLLETPNHGHLSGPGRVET